jgi:hypothetical protein
MPHARAGGTGSSLVFASDLPRRNLRNQRSISPNRRFGRPMMLTAFSVVIRPFGDSAQRAMASANCFKQKGPWSTSTANQPRRMAPSVPQRLKGLWSTDALHRPGQPLGAEVPAGQVSNAPIASQWPRSMCPGRFVSSRWIAGRRLPGVQGPPNVRTWVTNLRWILSSKARASSSTCSPVAAATCTESLLT